ncbi:MAG: glycosyltransferase [Bacteroidetes bacterium]|jgi:glycosyltransferase involved in cell wall biosynthesis|nr:glycosyltransferase [Bacteroidota bacterium]
MKRVLLLTYYFPPAGGPGVQRPLKFVRYLRQAGWEPVVLTVDGGAFPAADASLAADVPPGVTVERTPALDPFQLYARLMGKGKEASVKVGSVGDAQGWKERLAQWIRANLFLPDARVGWLPYAIPAGRRLIAAHGIDAVMTTGPPHSCHLAGWVLQRLTGCPWLADFRDPWTDINYYHELPHTALARRVDAGLERAVLRAAAQVVTVSPHWAQLLQQKKPPAAPVAVIQNGFDPADMPVDVTPRTDVCYVTHVGSLYASRNPQALWQALQRLDAAGAAPELRIRLVGTVAPDVQAAIAAHGVAHRVAPVPYQPHADALALLCESAAALLVIEAFPHDAGMITGKLYEYVGTGRHVIGVGPPDGDAAALLRATGAGRLWARDDVAGLEAALRRVHAAWAAGRPLAGAAPEAAAHYTRAAQTHRLGGLLDRLVASR